MIRQYSDDKYTIFLAMFDRSPLQILPLNNIYNDFFQEKMYEYILKAHHPRGNPKTSTIQSKGRDACGPAVRWKYLRWNQQYKARIEVLVDQQPGNQKYKTRVEVLVNQQSGGSI
eukprot:GHVU01216740.1.p2 GENE.GHVU01216740.1~~GHVU01216740.1.p2  ORF type:complete len:115 (+),score=11.56 GHVU01216740.1:1890-2234(+)